MLETLRVVVHKRASHNSPQVELDLLLALGHRRDGLSRLLPDMVCT